MQLSYDKINQIERKARQIEKRCYSLSFETVKLKNYNVKSNENPVQYSSDILIQVMNTILPYVAISSTVKKLVRDFICRPISGKELLFLKYGSYF